MKIGTNIYTNNFQNKFESNFGKKLKSLSFFYEPYLYFIAANSLAIKILSMLSILFYAIGFIILTQNYVPYEYTLAFTICYFLIYVPTGLHYNKSCDLTSDKIAKYGYEQKQFLIFELRTKE